MSSDLSPFSQFCCFQAEFPLLRGDRRNSCPLDFIMSDNSAWRNLCWKRLGNVRPISLPLRANLFLKNCFSDDYMKYIRFCKFKKGKLTTLD